jgi:hypothetical protein
MFIMTARELAAAIKKKSIGVEDGSRKLIRRRNYPDCQNP